MSKSQRVVKDKFAEKRAAEVSNTPLVPMNELQAEYIRLLREKPMVIATGLPGTSKTYIPTKMACQDYRLGQVDNIYITRPNVSNSKSLGFFGGNLEEKMANWLLPVLSVMTEVLGDADLAIGIKNGNIQFVPFEVIKGMSFNNAWVILDEAEDISCEEAKKFVTRLGKDVHCALAGDIEQSELADKNGLLRLIDIIKSRPTLADHIGLVDFNRPSDIVRSTLCKEWILGFREYEQS